MSYKDTNMYYIYLLSRALPPMNNTVDACTKNAVSRDIAEQHAQAVFGKRLEEDSNLFIEIEEYLPSEPHIVPLGDDE